MPKKKYECPCCGYLTLEEEPPGTFEICSVCFWEDDDVQFYDHDYKGGANGVSLNQARANYRRFGAIDEGSIPFVRKPRESEKKKR
jgi:hypothetical protein